MRRHHQEVHVVDHLIDREQTSVLARRSGELAEHVLPATFRASAQGFLGEILNKESTPVDALLHPGKGQRTAHRRDRGLHHIDESLVDLVGFRPPRQADEAVSGQIESQLLDRGVELLRPGPSRNLPGNPPVQSARIMPHRLGLEGDRKRAAIDPVMLEIDQHQAPREELVEHRSPALLTGEDLVLVEQKQLVGLGADQRDLPSAERAVLVNLAVGLDHPVCKGVRIGEHREGVADDGPARLARDMRQIGVAQAQFAPVARVIGGGRVGRTRDFGKGGHWGLDAPVKVRIRN